MGVFNEDIKTAKNGEDITHLYLLDSKSTKKVIDVRDDKFFQELDIDFLQQDIDNKINKIEVKTDTMAHRTGNFAYEHTSNKYYKTKGCFEKTQSDYIFYYVQGTKDMYVLDTKKLQKYVHSNSKTLKEVCMGDNALGYLIKLTDIEAKGLGYKIKKTA